MRLIAILVICAAVGVTAARASAPGAYAALAAPAAQDCVKLCEDDSLCVGWTYEAGACGLWASLPKDAPSQLTLSAHAPGFARRVEATQAVRAPPAARGRPNSAPHDIAPAALLGGYDGGDDIRPRLGGN